MESKWANLKYIGTLLFAFLSGLLAWQTRPFVEEVENNHGGWGLLLNDVIGILFLIPCCAMLFLQSKEQGAARYVGPTLQGATLFGFGVACGMALLERVRPGSTWRRLVK